MLMHITWNDNSDIFIVKNQKTASYVYLQNCSVELTGTYDPYVTRRISQLLVGTQRLIQTAILGYLATACMCMASESAAHPAYINTRPAYCTSICSTHSVAGSVLSCYQGNQEINRAEGWDGEYRLQTCSQIHCIQCNG